MEETLKELIADLVFIVERDEVIFRERLPGFYHCSFKSFEMEMSCGRNGGASISINGLKQTINDEAVEILCRTISSQRKRLQVEKEENENQVAKLAGKLVELRNPS